MRPSRLYRGYVVALLSFLSTGLAIGMTQYSFGEFAAPLQSQFGWSQTELNLSLSFGFISGIVAPLAGKWTDRFGVRPVMFGSLLLIAVGFALRPLMSELWHWYTLSAFVYAGFPGATVLPAGKVVAAWFPDSVGRMTGLVVAGNNFGGMTMPPIAATAIGLLSWHWAYLAFGATMVLLALAVVAAVTEDPRRVAVEMRRTGRKPVSAGERARQSLGLTVSQALRSASFWLTIIGITAATFTYQGVLTQLRQHFGEVGFAPAAATLAVTVIATMGIGSKLAFGRASERWSARRMTVLSLAFQAAGVVLMIMPNGGIAMVWAGVVVFALGFGGLGALIVLVVRQTFGMKSFGAIMGLFTLAQIISSSGGPILAGQIHDATGSFNLAFAIIVGIFVLGMVTLWIAPQPKFDGETGD